MANLASVYHWQPSEMKALAFEELLEYHALAIKHGRPI